MRKIKELKKRYDNWLDKKIYLELTSFQVQLNNYTAYLFFPAIFILIFIIIKELL
jgi:hypothetical protein